MRKVGVFDLTFAEQIYFYSEDNKVFYLNEKGETLSEDKELETWAFILNSPWSQSNENYIINVNCKDGYTKIPEGEPAWKCTHTVVGYEGVWADIIGYGNTEEEALKACKDLFKYIQETYNKENERF